MGRNSIILLFFVLLFGWLFFLMHGLTIGDSDDWDHLILSTETPWPVMLTNLLTPWSKSSSWSGFANAHDQVLYSRVFPAGLMKVVHGVWGFSFFPYYAVLKALFFILLNVFLFFLLRKLTKSAFYAGVGTLAFAFLPVHYMHLFWLSDPIVTAHGLMLAGIAAWLQLKKNAAEEEKFSMFCLGSLLLFLAGHFAIKTKAPAIILPLSLGACSLLHLRTFANDPRKAVILFALLAALAFQIVPIEHLGHSAERVSGQYKPENIVKIIFRNDANEYETETSTAFFSWESMLPVSLARNLGFLWLWTLVLFTVLYFFKTRRDPNRRILKNPIAQISVFWLLLEIPLMGFFAPEPRYLSGVFIPLTLLAASLIRQVIRSFSGWWKKVLSALPLAATITTAFLINVPHILFLRQLRGARYEQMHAAADLIYRDRIPGNAPSPDALGRYYCFACVGEETALPRLGDAVYHTEIGLMKWNKSPEKSAENFQDLAQKGSPFWLTFTSDRPPGGQVRKVAALSGFNPDSLFYRLYLRFRRKKPGPLHVYKWVGAP